MDDFEAIAVRGDAFLNGVPPISVRTCASVGREKFCKLVVLELLLVDWA